MIDPKQIRRGNLVNVGFLKNHAVISTTPEGIDVNDNGFGMVHLAEWKEVDPIPLTDEWLVKFGFERDEELEKLEENRYRQWRLGDPITHMFIRIIYHSVGRYTLYYRGCPIIKPEYVHQLQNICLDLTEKELVYEH